MDSRVPYKDALRTAAETLGGEQELASRLGVPAEELHSWLEGNRPPPLDAFLGALDVIADGPYRRPRRRVRVAVLHEDPARAS